MSFQPPHLPLTIDLIFLFEIKNNRVLGLSKPNDINCYKYMTHNTTPIIWDRSPHFIVKRAKLEVKSFLEKRKETTSLC